MACFYCGATDELRPYGPSAADICFDCMKADPERESEAKRHLGARIAIAQAASPTGQAALADDVPPIPYTPDDMEM